MFCASLRARRDLRGLVAELTNAKQPKLKECKLGTHDLDLPIPTEPQSVLHLLVLTKASLASVDATDATLSRIERFSTMTGGADIAIAFILAIDPSESASVGLHAFTSLQMLMLTNKNLPLIPILPINNIGRFLLELDEYTSARARYSSMVAAAPSISARRDLLPHVTMSASEHTLSEHNTNVLSDLCGSLSDVATLAGSDEGRSLLGDWLEAAADGVINFWAEERVV